MNSPITHITTISFPLTWKAKPTEETRLQRQLQKLTKQLHQIQQAWPEQSTEKSSELFMERINNLLNTLNQLANEGPTAQTEQLDNLLSEIEACQEEVKTSRIGLTNSSVPLNWSLLAWGVLTAAALTASTLLLLSGASMLTLSAATLSEILFGLTIAPRLIQAVFDLLGFQAQAQKQANKPLKDSLKKLDQWLFQAENLTALLFTEHEQQAAYHEGQAQQMLYQAIVAKLSVFIFDLLFKADIAMRLNQVALIEPERPH